jgi:hypothetical protein
MKANELQLAKSRRSSGPLYAALFALTLGLGCGTNLPPRQFLAYESRSSEILLFARNPIVCAPTVIGNGAGAVLGFGLAASMSLPSYLAERFSGNEGLKERIDGALYLGPTLLGGALTGVVFLPISYLIGEHPCDLGLVTQG